MAAFVWARFTASTSPARYADCDADNLSFMAAGFPALLLNLSEASKAYTRPKEPSGLTTPGPTSCQAHNQELQNRPSKTQARSGCCRKGTRTARKGSPLEAPFPAAARENQKRKNSSLPRRAGQDA